MANGDVLPKTWTDAELLDDIAASRKRFVEGMLSRGTAEYERIFYDAMERMASIMGKTADLTKVGENMGKLDAEEKALIRYVSAPPLSDDDAKTIAAYLRDTAGLGGDASLAEAVMSSYDPLRFDWVGRGAAPSADERDEAMRWTCGLYAAQRIATKNRAKAGKQQEQAVRDALAECGYVQDARKGFTLDLLDDLSRGSFRNETKVASVDAGGRKSYTKADVPIRLADGRLMLVECKVSNSDVNSIKRVERETCGKASGWRNSFGQGIVLALVFDGVASLATLRKAQSDYGEYIFWGHRLDDLKDFIMACGKAPEKS